MCKLGLYIKILYEADLFFSISDFFWGGGGGGEVELKGPRSNACFHSLTRNSLDGLTKYPVRRDIKKGQEIITYFPVKRLAQVKHGGEP